MIRRVELELFGRRYRKALRTSDVVIDGYGICDESMNNLRSERRAKVFFNHPGSIYAYVGGWRHAIDLEQKYLEHLAFLQGYDGVICQSATHAQEINALSGAEDFATVVKPSVREPDIARALGTRSPYRAGEIPIVVTGWAQPRKNWEEAIQSFEIVARQEPRAHLYFVGGVGDEEYFENIEGKVRELQLRDRITFTGHRTDFLRFIRHSHVFLQTSFAEGISRALREAAALGVPAVVSDVPGWRDMIADGASGIHCPAGDIEAIATAILSLIQDDYRRREMGRGAKEFFAKNWSALEHFTSVAEFLSNTK